jgi:hypothetical protein
MDGADLQALRSPDPGVRKRGRDALYDDLPLHGGSTEAAARAVPYLIGLAADPATPEREWVLDLLGGIAVGNDVEILPQGVPERYRRDPAYAAVSEGVPLFRALLAEASLAADAAALLAWFPAHAEGSLAALWARLGTGAAGGAGLAAIGLLGDATLVPRLEPFLRDEDAVRRWGAAIALARLAGDNPPDGVVEELVRAACGDVPGLGERGIVFMHGEMPHYAAVSLKLLGPAVRPAAVEQIARSFAEVDSYTGQALVDALLALAFPTRLERGTPFAALAPHQQHALGGLMTAAWFVVGTPYPNVPYTLAEYRLPMDARGLDAYIRGKRRLR